MTPKWTNMEQMANLRTLLEFRETFQIGSSSSSLREIAFTIEPPLGGEDKVLYDGAKMTSNMMEPLLNAMRHRYYTNKHE